MTVLEIVANLLLCLVLGAVVGNCYARVAECQSCWHGTCYSSAQCGNGCVCLKAPRETGGRCYGR